MTNSDPELDFTPGPRYGEIQTLDVCFSDFIAWCRGKRVIMVVVKQGYYRAQFRDQIPR